MKKKYIFATVCMGIITGLILTVTYLCYANRIKPLLISYAGAKAVSDTTAALNEAFLRAVPNDVGYNSIIAVNRNENGQVESLTADTAKINEVKARVIKAATEELEALPSLKTRVPVGTLTPFAILYGKGPALTFYSFQAGGLTAEFSNDFTSAGINYTLHRITLTLSVKITVVIPGGTVDKEVTSDFFIAETVLSGGIPEIYIRSENGG